MRPKDSPKIGMEEWLNVFVLHQNRVQHGASAKNCLQERHLPAFMDLVIWGHEHECIPEPQVCGVTFVVTFDLNFDAQV
jgi:double-strand break repair protein MRE11